MKKVFSKIWLIWGAIVFLSSTIWVWPSYQIARLFTNKETIYSAAFKVSRVWANYLLIFLGVRVKLIGDSKKYANQQVIYVCNHRSQIDIPLNFATSPEFVILSKSEALKIPVVATNLRLGHVTVNRKSNESRKHSFNQLKNHLANGQSVFLYPEGRRVNEEKLLGKFYDGAFILAKEFQLPVVPITIIGSDKINNPKNPLAILPGKVTICFDDAIDVNSDSDINAIKEAVKEVMKKRLSNTPNN